MTPCLRGFSFAPLAFVLAVMALAGTGCTSALTTASLRGLPWDTAETKAEASDEADTVAAAGDSAEADDATAAVDHDAQRAAAIEEAISRLSKVGSLDAQTQATLMTALQNTAPEDWPVVIAEFAAALATTGTEPGAAHVVAKAELAPPAPAPVPAAETAPSPAPADEPEAAPEPPAPAAAATVAAEPAPTDVTVADSVPAAEPPPAHEPAAIEPARSVSIRTACFASRVQRWGVFDRFPTDRFAPGQEVIVYVELDDLAATTAADGHTTCIDAALRLVDADGRTLADWNFEPIAETCASRRRDYFARFVVRIPETAAAGRGHVALTVTDTLAGKTVDTTLPLEITAD